MESTRKWVGKILRQGLEKLNYPDGYLQEECHQRGANKGKDRIQELFGAWWGHMVWKKMILIGE